MTVGTTIALPVVRGPGPLAKALAAIDRLSDGRLVVGLGPGLVRTRLPRGRAGLGGAVAQVRGGRSGAPRAPAPGRRRVRGSVLLDGRDGAAPRAAPARRSADLARELGLGRRTAAGCAPRRRLAGVGVQHDARGVRRGPPAPGGSPACGRDRSRAGSRTRSRPMWLHVTEDAAAADAVLTDVLGARAASLARRIATTSARGARGRVCGPARPVRAAGVERVLLWPVGERARAARAIPRHRSAQARGPMTRR